MAGGCRYRSLLIVPMLREGVSIGTLAVSHVKLGRFTDRLLMCATPSPTKR